MAMAMSSCLSTTSFASYRSMKFRRLSRCCRPTAYKRVLCCQATSDEATAVQLPCLPFNAAEVLVPSSSKTLHLYEARFLALLEEAMKKCNNLFVHVVIERTGRAANEYIFRYGCLSHIQQVKRLEIGALVTIRGIGRVRLVSLSQVEPFVRGVVVPLKDEAPNDMEEIVSSVQNLKETLSDVQQLQIKLKTSQTELLQTPLEGALQWAEKTSFTEQLEYFIPNREERLSFAALQPISGANAGELKELLQRRLTAMDSTDTLERLQASVKYAMESRSSVAAKVAIQSLEL